MSNDRDTVKPVGDEVLEGSRVYIDLALEGLIERIADGSAVVYVGAGVSQSAEMLSWQGLLDRLQKEASGRMKIRGQITEKYFSTSGQIS
jgi:hypothetical protein